MAVQLDWPEVLCAVAGTDLVLLLTPSSRARSSLRRLEYELVLSRAAGTESSGQLRAPRAHSLSAS